MRVHFGRLLGTFGVTAALVGLTASSALAQEIAPSPDTTAPPYDVTFSPAFSTSTTASPVITFGYVDQANQSNTAQTTPPPSKPHHEGLGIGVKGGFLFSSLGDSPIDGSALSNATGEAIGLWFGGNRPGRIGVEGELMYNIRKGTDLQGDTLAIHSLEIPVLIRVNVGSSSLNGVLGYVIVGPAVDLQLSASLFGQSVKSNYKGVNLDVIFGGGIEITRFFIEAREDLGLRSVNNGDFGNTSSIHAKTFALLFGFRFN